MNTNTAQNTTTPGIAGGGPGERAVAEKGAGSAAEGTGTGVGTTAGTGGIGTKVKYVASQGLLSKQLTILFFIEAHIM